jgi:putative DNA primase/helicase
VDLRTGELRAHNREDAITKITAVTPPSTADCPLWQECLHVWTKGDNALSDFLRRLAGYCLTGSVKEEVLPIVHGPGGNGKSRFVETLRAAIGDDYVTGVAMETLIVTAGHEARHRERD